MRKMIIALAAAALLPASATAQNAYEYTGDRVDLETHYFQCRAIGNLSGAGKKAQLCGMAVAGTQALSLLSNGSVTTYKIEGSSLNKVKQFKLDNTTGSQQWAGASFGCRAAEGQEVPVLFVSNSDGTATAVQLDANLKSATAAATISLQGQKPTRWVADADAAMLYAVTVQSGKLSVLKFEQPSATGEVKLSKTDALENFTLSAGTKATVRGMCIKGGMLYATIATSKGTSRLLVWDLSTRALRNSIDLSQPVRESAGDCAVGDSELYIQADSKLYQLSF